MRSHLDTPRIGSLFSGYGGLEMGAQSVIGGTTAWVSDVDPGACKILAHRYPEVPNHGDITRIDWTSVEPVDVLAGGSPCQDMSDAGKRQGLMPHTRSGLWSYMADAIAYLRPALVVWENVRGALSAPAYSDVEPCPWCVGDAGDGEPPLRALGAVLGDLADLGYDAQWVGLRAADVGAPHGRFRVFVVARPAPDTRGGRLGADVADIPAGESDPRRLPPPRAADDGLQRSWSPRSGRDGPPDRRDPAPDAAGDGRRRGHDAAGASGVRGGVRPGAPGPAAPADWGTYGPAVHRWEHILGRPAPHPLGVGTKGQEQLSAGFVEWMMGLPAGWVTDVPGLSRNDQLKALGNGVVPQQAAAAVRVALAGARELAEPAA